MKFDFCPEIYRGLLAKPLKRYFYKGLTFKVSVVNHVIPEDSK